MKNGLQALMKFKEWQVENIHRYIDLEISYLKVTEYLWRH